MSDIFISHSSHDAAAAAEVSQWLASLGHRSVFLDFDPTQGIAPGRIWERELYQQLRSCRAVIALLSEHSLNSKWCFAEITHARALGKPVFPVRLDDTKPEGIVTDRQVVSLVSDRSDGYRRLARGLVEAGLDPRDAFDWDSTRPVYPGLFAFQERDAAIFFGRDEEIRDGLDRLNRVAQFSASRWLTVVGASGSGKSSFVRAGLIPRLKRDPARWTVVEPFRPASHFRASLASALARTFERLESPRSAAAIDAALRSRHVLAPESIHSVFSGLRALTEGDETTVLVIIDQFEEVLRNPTDPDVVELLQLLRDECEADSRLAMVTVVRSDFLSAFQNHPSLRGLAFDSLVLGQPSTEDLAEVVQRPAQLRGIDVTIELATALVSDCESEGALPLLAFTLRELLDRYGDQGVLTLSHYRDGLGGLAGALSKVAEEVLASEALSPGDEALLESAFMRLVYLTVDAKYVKRIGHWSELPPKLHPLIEKMVSARLLVSSDDAENQRTIEVVHDDLFLHWARMQAWLGARRTQLELSRELGFAAAAWATDARPQDGLWIGTKLAQAVELTKKPEWSLDERSVEFVAAGEQAAHRREAVAAARRRRTLITLASIALVGVVLAMVTFVALQDSRRAERDARFAALSVEARLELPSNPDLAALLAVAAHNLRPSSAEAIALLGDVRRGPFAYQVVVADPLVASADDGTAFIATREGKLQRADPSGELSPVGQFPAGITALGGTAGLIFVASGGGLIVLDSAGDQIAEIALDASSPPVRLVGSTDGRYVAVAREDASLQVYSWESGEVIANLAGHPNAIRGIAFSSDSSYLGSVSDDRLIVWDIQSGQSLLQRFDEADFGTVQLVGVIFDSDGAVVVASADGGLWAWSVAAPVPGSLLWSAPEVSRGGIVALAYDAPGGLIAIGARDGEVLLWNARTRLLQESAVMPHREIQGLAFLPNGRLVSWSADRLRAWNLDGGGADTVVLKAHDTAIRSAAVWRDAGLLLSGGEDGVVRGWSLGSLEPAGEFGRLDSSIRSIEIAPSGRQAVVVAQDGQIELWFLATDSRSVDRKVPVVGSGWPNELIEARGAAWRPDGSEFSVAISTGVVFRWDARTLTQIATIPAHTTYARSLVYSPDGNMLASGGGDGVVVVWDVTERQAPTLKARLEIGKLTEVTSLGFAPSGKTIVIGSGDGSFSTWDWRGGTHITSPIKHASDIRAVGISEDGEWAISGGYDGSVRLWRLAGLRPWQVIHTSSVEALELEETARQAYSVHSDGSIRRWDLDFETWPERLCRAAGEALSLEETQPYEVNREVCGR